MSGHTVIQPGVLGDLAVLDMQHCRTCEMHLATHCWWQRSRQEVLESRTRVGASAFPAADNVVPPSAIRIRGAPEIEIGKDLRNSS